MDAWVDDVMFKGCEKILRGKKMLNLIYLNKNCFFNFNRIAKCFLDFL